MADATRVERLLSAGLAEVAAAARPPTDAWERFLRRRRADPAATDVEGRSGPSAVGTPSGSDRQEQPSGREIPMRENGNDRSPRPWTMVAVAAAVIAVVVVGLVLVARDTDDPVPATDPETVPTVTPTTRPEPIELRGADGDPAARDAFLSVEAAYRAFNAGDIETWAISYLEDDLGPADRERELGHLEAARAAGARYDVDGCDYVGVVEHDLTPDEVGDDPDASSVVSGPNFLCSATMTDAFTVASGIDFVENWTWMVADRPWIVDGDFDSRTQLRDFLGDFRTWLRINHPDVEEEMTFVEWYNYPVAADVPRALEFVDRFVASDDRWPIGDGS